MKSRGTNRPIVLFIPEAGIYPFLRGLSVLGDAIAQCGGKVLVTHDTGQLLRSPIMAMHKTSVDATSGEKLEISKITNKYINRIQTRYKFSTISLKEIVDEELMDEINSLNIRNMRNLKKVQFRGFPVGEMAEFDFILETKNSYSHNLSKEHFDLYKQYIKNTSLAIAITDRICELYNPSLILTFNEYAQCQAVWYSAEKHNVRHMALTYPVHMNIDASRFSIWKSTYQLGNCVHCQNWAERKDQSISSKNVKACWEDSVFRMYSSGSHIYSSRKGNSQNDIYKKLGLDKKRKTIIVYTSSEDERSTGQISMKIWSKKNPFHDVFRDQIDWLVTLRRYALKRPDVQIIVRIHPREATKIHELASSHLRKLKSIFRNEYENFRIIWPNDPISSYDLMELADVCLVSWSLMGQEAARLGIPVLSYVSHMFYPDDDFIQVATNVEEYEKKLDKIVQTKYTWKQLVKAIRFYHWRTFVPTLDLSPSVPKEFDDDTVWPKIPLSMAKIVCNILFEKEGLIKYNIIKWSKLLPVNAIYQENRAIKWGIRYVLHYLYYPPISPNNHNIFYRIWHNFLTKVTHKNIRKNTVHQKYIDYKLKFSENSSRLKEFIAETKVNPKLRILVANWPQAILVNNGKIISRTSPLVIRLAKLYEHKI